MDISDKGKEFIKSFEGCKLKAYRCQAGVLTIGYGRTKDVTDGMTITQADADKFFDEDIQEFVTQVNDLVKGLSLTQNQFDALISFAYNLGTSKLANSTLLKYLKQGKTYSAAEEFLKWNKVSFGKKKVISNGLDKRRKAEKELFLNGNYVSND